MRIIAFDPGESTGFCGIRANNKHVTVFTQGELSLAEFNAGTVHFMLQKHAPDAVVIEGVVATGRLNQAKFNQIRAFDRAQNGAASYLNQGSIAIMPPETRKHHQVNVPDSVSGSHARDAYRIGVAFLIKKGKVIIEQPDTKSEKDSE